MGTGINTVKLFIGGYNIVKFTSTVTEGNMVLFNDYRHVNVFVLLH